MIKKLFDSVQKILSMALMIVLLHPSSHAQTDNQPAANNEIRQNQQIKWTSLEEGLEFAELKGNYKGQPADIHSNIILLRVSLETHILIAHNTKADDGNFHLSRDLTIKNKYLAAVNANFYDTNNNPLGVVLNKGITSSRIHQGGGLLTGIFQIKQNLPSIIHRSKFQSAGVDLAVQSGPRLIEDGQPLKIKHPHKTSRRSCIATTRDNKVIIIATKNRLPGVSLLGVQKILLRKDLNIKDALNLDGGGSSQLYIKKFEDLPDGIDISGGDKVPVSIAIENR